MRKKWSWIVAGIIVVLFFVAVYLPSFLDARVINKWYLVCHEMKSILDAEARFSQTHGGKYAALAQLAGDGSVDPELASGQKYGYSFTLVTTDSGFRLDAVPLNYKESSFRSGQGAYSFHADEKGVTHGGDKKGGRATPDDDELDCTLRETGIRHVYRGASNRNGNR